MNNLSTTQLAMLCTALGWQGGTYHQVLERVRVLAGQRVCTWTPDEDGTYWTSCDNGHVFTDGGPHENDARWCCYCGGHLEPTKQEFYAQEDLDEAQTEAKELHAGLRVE